MGVLLAVLGAMALIALGFAAAAFTGLGLFTGNGRVAAVGAAVTAAAAEGAYALSAAIVGMTS